MLTLRNTETSFFHVHTYRCGHAEDIPDEAYVKQAIDCGASDIWFTDHAPFPGDPFGARMRYAELDEYLETLTALREKYRDIRIHIGLETEYFPNFDKSGYYAHLRSIPELEILLLGQHMAETSASPLTYSFSMQWDELMQNEYKLLGHAIVQGIRSGYFDAVAHPDRIFRRYDTWDDGTQTVSAEIIQAADEAGLPLEMNLCSAETSIYYKREFWQLVPDSVGRIIGYDAHSVYEMRSRQQGMRKRLQVFT